MAVGGGVGKLLISIGLKSTVKADGKRVEKETGAIAKGIEKKGLMIGAGMTAVGVGAKVMADNINKSYLTFDSAMAEVKSLGGVTEEQMEIMRNSAIGISKELPLSAQNVAGGFYMMRSAGFDAARVIEELPAIAEMAVAGNLEMADAVNATTMVLDVYGEAAGSAADITNVLMGTVQAFKTTLPELQVQLSKNIGVAANLGISFGELAAMSGLLKKDFVSAEEGGTALKTTLLRLVDPTVLAQMEDMGVKVTDANGDFVGMTSLLEGLSTKLDEAGGDVEQMAMLQKLFGAEGVRAAMSLIRQKDNLKGYTDAVSSGTSVQEALNAILGTTQSKLDIANNKMEAAKITMGEAMAPATIVTAEALAGFAGVLEDIPGPLQTVIGGGLQFSKAFIGIGPLLMGISAVYPVYTAAQLTAAAAGMTLTASIWHTTIAMLANPIFWIPAVIMVVVGALYVLEKKFGVVTKAVDFMSKGIKKLVGWLKPKLAPAINIVQRAVAIFGDKLLLLLGPIGVVILGIKRLIGWWKKNRDEAKESAEATVEAGEVMTDAMKDVEEQARSVEKAQYDVKDAQEEWNEAIIEYGEDSDEAGRASLRFKDTQDELTDAQDKLNESIEKGGDEVAEFADEAVSSLEQIATATVIPEFSDLLAQFDEVGKKQKLIDETVADMANLSEPIKDYELALKDAENAEKDLNDAIKATGDLKSEVDTLTGAYEDLERAMKSITDLNEDIEDQGRTIEHAQFRLADAEEAYSEAVEEYGADSREAAEADLDLRDAKDRLDDAQKRQKKMEGELGEATETKGEIEKEYNVDSLTELGKLLESKQTEYNAALLVEETARNAHKLVMDRIAELEADEQIAQWKRAKEYIEANPAKASVEITKYIRTVSTAGVEGSKQYGGVIAKTGLYMLHKDEVVVPASASPSPATSGIPTVHQEFTIYNYSDIENLERNIAEAVNRGIHGKYSLR